MVGIGTLRTREGRVPGHLAFGRVTIAGYQHLIHVERGAIAATDVEIAVTPDSLAVVRRPQHLFEGH